MNIRLELSEKLYNSIKLHYKTLNIVRKVNSKTDSLLIPNYNIIQSHYSLLLNNIRDPNYPHYTLKDCIEEIYKREKILYEHYSK